MPQINLEKLLPNIDGKIDPIVEREIYLAFRRIYEYVDFTINNLKTELTNRIKGGEIIQDDVNSLIGIFSQPLIGSSTVDPLLQSIVQSFGIQAANNIFAAPSGVAGTPVFRLLTSADIPGLDAAKIISGAIALSRLDTKIMNTNDAFTKTIAGAPYANDGFIVARDNAGNTVKLLTTA